MCNKKEKKEVPTWVTLLANIVLLIPTAFLLNWSYVWMIDSAKAAEAAETQVVHQTHHKHAALPETEKWIKKLKAADSHIDRITK